MKYFLALDRGPYQKIDRRYLKLDLEVLGEDINKSLNRDNNLKELCTFTMSFLNETLLKQLLYAKGILRLEDKYYSLKIVYKRNYKGKEIIKALDVPYKKHEKYFKFESLAMIIKDNAWKSKEFFRAFLSFFEQDSFKKEEFYMLREMEFLNLEENILYDRIRAFINARCEVRGKNKHLNFRKLYEIAMLVAKLDNGREENQVKKLDDVLDIEHLSEVQKFELEEWQDRLKQDEEPMRQLKLF